MLVLTRKEGERVVINFPGQRVVLEVCKVEGDRVRLGFDAPRSVAVLREEIADRPAREAVGA